MELHTSNFTAVHKHLRAISLEDVAFTPVRTSLGAPRFIPGARSWPYAHMLAPAGIFKIQDRAEFTLRYRDLLDRHGVDNIGGQLLRIFTENREKPLLLLCFEDLNRSWCHRTIFAAWWAEKTGQVVPETSPENFGPRPASLLPPSALF